MTQKSTPKKASRSESESRMRPRPIYENPSVKGSDKLLNKVAIVTGGDSGIGRAISIALAKEGADVVIVYLKQKEDAEFTKQEVISHGRRCITIAGDIGNESFCQRVVKKTIKHFEKLDILINNAAYQSPQDDLLQITKRQLEKTFKTNIFSYFFMTRAALPYLKRGASVINTSSVTAYRGSEHLIDYSASKGAIISFTRSLAKNLAETGIRVNAVAPGPIWTPLVAHTFKPKELKTFGTKTPMKRPGQPAEVAPAFIFLASEEASYITGQVIHPNGGEIVNS